MEKAPTSVESAYKRFRILKTLLWHYEKQTLTPESASRRFQP